MKPSSIKYVVSGVLVVGLVWFGVTAFNESLTPYKSFREARKMTGYVQVNGTLPHPEQSSTKEGILRFELRDEEGEVLQVAYEGVKPVNFELATSVVAIGKYQEGVFHADQLLVKCPSKYQAEGGDGYMDAEDAPPAIERVDPPLGDT